MTKGHNVYDFEGWFFKIAEWFPKAFPSSTFSSMNGAVPATGSDYYSYCFPLHIPHDTDLVFVELGVNDEALIEHYDNMENLLRGLLAMEKQPAVILVEAAAFSTGGMAGGGGRMHLPIAQYFGESKRARPAPDHQTFPSSTNVIRLCTTLRDSLNLSQCTFPESECACCQAFC